MRLSTYPLSQPPLSQQSGNSVSQSHNHLSPALDEAPESSDSEFGDPVPCATDGLFYCVEPDLGSLIAIIYALSAKPFDDARCSEEMSQKITVGHQVTSKAVSKGLTSRTITWHVPSEALLQPDARPVTVCVARCLSK